MVKTSFITTAARELSNYTAPRNWRFLDPSKKQAHFGTEETAARGTGDEGLDRARRRPILLIKSKQNIYYD
jgi:hypothetical protein